MSIAKRIFVSLIAAAFATFVARGAYAQTVQIEHEETPTRVALSEPGPESTNQAARSSVATRVVVELFAGGLTAFGSMIAFAVPTLSTEAGVVAAPFGAITGVQLGGMMMGNHGGFGWTLLGGLAGGFVAIPISAGLLIGSGCIDDIGCQSDDGQALFGTAIATLIFLPTLGAIIAHENSSDDAEDRMDAVRIAPSIAPTTDMSGATASIVGTF